MQHDAPDPARRRSLGLGLGGFAVAAAALPSRADAQAAPGESRLDTVMKRGKLLVATFNSSPPLCFTDDKGAMIGFDIDFTRSIAKAMFGDPDKVDFQIVDSSGRWPAVLSGRADFGISGTTIYPDRALRVCFTSRYMDSSISILVSKDSGIDSLEQLNDPKYTVANLSNPQMADRAKRFFPRTQVLTFETVSALMLAVKTGQAQAMQMDTPIVDWYALNDNAVKVLPALLGNVQNNAIFLKPGDFTWWLYLDTVVKEMLTGSRYDEYTAIFNKWFGRNPPPERFYMKA